MPTHLLSLELQGYKTFANRTLFAFSDTVTAIVGPNGSGKSNIADSLRWVLGEQSYSLLRAKKTEDMIFSGSENRSRAGMASACVTFDNSDGWLPIDFNEVAITRRAYRDGDNEYLVNGQRVRLRDVHELLSQSGLSERTYTVIGQGLVDAALSLKAEERRRLFEEAAGIGLYRTRREEALRRLENTQRNLERVEDILAELVPRLGSLERQAKRAREYGQLNTDLRVLLREWYGYHWHELQRELAEARETARTQEKRVADARQEQLSVSQKFSSMRERVQVLRSGLNSWHKQIAQLHLQRETTSRQLAVSEERSRSLTEQQQATDGELISLEHEIALYQALIQTGKQEITDQTTDIEAARVHLADAQKVLEARQQQRLQVEGRLQEVQQKVNHMNAELGRLQGLLLERQAQTERAQVSQLELSIKLTEAEAQVEKAAFEMQTASQAEEQSEERKNQAEETLHLHTQRVDAVETERRNLQEQITATGTERARLQAQRDVLEQAETALSGYASGTRLLLQAARQGRLHGVLGVVNEYLQVPARFETAIAAVLGDYIDAVVLEAETDPALDLVHSASGRGVLIPTSSLTTQHGVDNNAARNIVLRMQSDPAVLGIAADLVEVSEELQKTFALLLGQVVIVQDRSTARSIIEGQPSGVCAVTLQGEVFHATGPIHVFGIGDKDTEQTLFGRTRQRRELAETLKSLETIWKKHDRQRVQIDQDLNDLRLTGDDLIIKQREASRIWEGSIQNVNQSRLAVEQAHRQLQWHRNQLTLLQTAIETNQSEVIRLGAEASELELSLTQVQAQAHQTSRELDELTLDEALALVTNWTTRIAVAERALENVRFRQEDRQTGLDKLLNNQKILKDRIVEFGKSLDKEAAERVGLHRTETEANEQIKKIQTQLDPAEVELAGLENEQIEIEKADAAARQTLSILERYYSQARINLDRRQESLAALRRRIEDDFGLVAFDYAEQISGPTPLPLEGMVEQLPILNKLPPGLEEAIQRQRAQLRRLGAINPEAQAEYQEVKQRFDFLTGQVADLHQAEGNVRQVIAELGGLMEHEFRKTFQAVAAEFRQIFTRLFGGGSARLTLTDPDNFTYTGIDIEARLPGRRTQGLALLSGGERSLTAVALIFALLKVSPTPFCVLDEVDAMLDEVNVGRFRELLRELSMNTQFVIVTHNRNTVQAADVIYGVTMGRDSVSQVLSLKLDEISQVVE